MNIEMWAAFVVASSILLIIPGPTILTVVSYSMTHGHRVKIPLVVAVALGDSTALVLSLLGLGSLLAKSAFWFMVVKWMGGLYLLYLGISLIREGFKPGEISIIKERDSGWRLFANTYLVTALNPKGIVFFIAFLPQFISTGQDLSFQLWVLATTFVGLATINAALYAIFAGKARQLLDSPKARRVFNFSGGTLLSIAGLWALSVKRV